ncbi:FAD-dependent monooxygenase [Streptomyces smyrnaeus]|uniref:FAD-dependent monooxygenase n=1 Tax=Streptomyces smyrnaeus TaxID=1387713 RepID=A0ABS3Y5R5_9ACTN|nr:FAD-dependent monooxygenase [Streptomyces smyrnaeus]MBO8203010.1 FAD-dependent monooxygenase [Streptomyces smyrnaeus]
MAPDTRPTRTARRIPHSLETPGRGRVLISGASVAGPALAYWLHRYGFRVTVVERAPALRPGGQAIDVRGPAIEVARRMGVLDELRAHATELRGMSVLDEDGNDTHSTTDVTVSGGRLDRDDIEILRDDLVRILVRAGGPGIEYLFDDSIARIDDCGDEIRVRFTGGHERAFDIVVGADGIHSHTRALAFGPEEQFLRPLAGHLGVWTAPNILDLDRWQIVYRTRDEQTWGSMVMSVRNNSELRVYVGLNGLDHSDPALRDPQVQKQLIAERYAHMGWEIPRLLTYMWEAPDFHFDAGAQIHMDSWSTGRVVLLGDAGYCGSPASGQGSSMAMVAAHVLAGQLKAADGDHRRAFAAYERELRPWVTANQALADRQIDRAENAGNAEKSSENSGGGENSLPTFVDDDFYAVVDDFILPDHGEQGATAR